MRPTTLIDMTVKRRQTKKAQGLHYIEEDSYKNLAAETAKEILELKYLTKRKKKNTADIKWKTHTKAKK